MSTTGMKHTIWTNDIDIEDYRDLLELPEYEDFDDEMLYNEAYEANREEFWDEKANLNKYLGRDIIVCADLGLWDGRHAGYKVIENAILNEIFDIGNDIDYVTWYVDEEDELKLKGVHHDGTNYYTFRLVKDLSEEEMDEYIVKRDYDGFTNEDIERFTEKLGPMVNEIYGWH